MDLAQILDLGATGLLAVGILGLWRSHQRQQEFIQALLSAELDRNESDRLAEKQRRKIARGVGVDLDEDTQGSRPAGFSARVNEMSKKRDS